MNELVTGGMATEKQLEQINQIVSAPSFSLPLAGFLKNVTGGRVSSLEELTYAEANDVIGLFKKLVK